MFVAVALFLVAPAAAQVCAARADCDDGLFCNGYEACLPTHPQAGADGCVAGVPPCDPRFFQTLCRCNEDLDGCVRLGGADCSFGSDIDGDGRADVVCGGDDCNDCNGSIYPGNVETCDEFGVDDDCNPLTLGQVDTDADGYIDVSCCNASSCGRDCDDLDTDVNPSSPEVCNYVDDNCDGLLDADSDPLWIRGFVDLDADGFGDANAPVDVCPQDLGDLVRISGDCNTLASQVHPGAPEVCNGIDDDCDGAIDEGFSAPCD